jgi:UDP-galactopyranose mutase
MAKVAVIGAGWAGASCARALTDRDIHCEVFERSGVVAGHSRLEALNGVLYEPNGPHIFHTSNAEVCDFVVRFGMRRAYEHRIKTAVELDPDRDLLVLSWPPQLDELEGLPQWREIRAELDRRPAVPDDTNFETSSVSAMGETLYRLFVYGYTVKQWGCEPSQLSANLGRRGVAVGGADRRVFSDRWEFWPPNGANEVIERMLSGIPVAFGSTVSLQDGFEALERAFDAVVVTAAVDEFLGRDGSLAWRGIRSVPQYSVVDTPTAKRTLAYQVNQPSLRVPFTRTVETKWASGQLIDATVVCEEYPGAPFRHYPVVTIDGHSETVNAEMQSEVRAAASKPVFFCGRLANYQYIDQDQAVAQGLDTARRVQEYVRP